MSYHANKHIQIIHICMCTRHQIISSSIYAYKITLTIITRRIWTCVYIHAHCTSSFPCQPYLLAQHHHTQTMFLSNHAQTKEKLSSKVWHVLAHLINCCKPSSAKPSISSFLVHVCDGPTCKIHTLFMDSHDIFYAYTLHYLQLGFGIFGS